MTTVWWIVGGTPVLLLLIAAAVGAALPRTHRLTRMARFRAAPAAVDAVVRDVTRSPQWRRGLTAVTMLPDPAGRPHYRETTRHGPVTYRVRVDDPGVRRIVEIADENLPYGGRWTFEFLPAGGGTELRLTEEGEVKNIVFRFLARFVWGHATSVEAYLTDLAQALSEPPPDFR